MFLQLFKHGLAYQADGIVNWDPVDQTVLANEQVDEKGRSWRSGAVVEKKVQRQWYFKITEYAERLEKDVTTLTAWPSSIKEAQINWIGKSKGVLFNFKLKGFHEHVEVFSKHPELIYGVAFIALTPMHPLVGPKLLSEECYAAVRRELQNPAYFEGNSKNPLGIRIPLIAVHPISGLELPVFVSNLALGQVGTQAIMGVPAHIPAHHEFSKAHSLPMIHLGTPRPNGLPVVLPFELLSENVPLIHRGPSLEVRSKIMKDISSVNAVAVATRFKLHDWLVSRQRYWGTPIPLIHCTSCGSVPVPVAELPVQLPLVEFVLDDYKNGNPLERHPTWKHVKCPSCKAPAIRETDTMDTFVDSSWYFLRFLDPFNDTSMVSPETASQFLPVDTYIGGVEHATSHLLYARFIFKFLKDIGTIPFKVPDEPFKCLVTQGMVHGKTFKDPDTGGYLKPDQVEYTCKEAPVIRGTKKAPSISWEKMSKSKWNGVDPQVPWTFFVAF